MSGQIFQGNHLIAETNDAPLGFEQGGIEVTQAQYDQLVEDGNVAEDTNYYITDTKVIMRNNEKIADVIQVPTLPTAAQNLLGRIYQYAGPTDNVGYDVIHGAFYECIYDEDNDMYKWSKVSAEGYTNAIGWWTINSLNVLNANVLAHTNNLANGTIIQLRFLNSFSNNDQNLPGTFRAGLAILSIFTEGSSTTATIFGTGFTAGGIIDQVHNTVRWIFMNNEERAYGEDISDLVAAGGHIKLGPGSYICGSGNDGVDIPANTVIEGDGLSRTIVWIKSGTTTMFKITNPNIEFRNLMLAGTETLNISASAARTQTGVFVSKDATAGTDARRCLFDNVCITQFGLYGLHIENTGSDGGLVHTPPVRIHNCYFIDNFFGLHLNIRAEYNLITDSIFTQNNQAIWNIGGNNQIDNCMLNNNKIAFIGNSQHDNDSHSSITGCQFNHNTQHAVYVFNMDNGYLFTGCQFYDAKIELMNCQQFTFVGNFFGSATLDITNPQFSTSKNFFMDNIIADHITVANHENCVFANNYTKDGTAWTGQTV